MKIITDLAIVAISLIFAFIIRASIEIYQTDVIEINLYHRYFLNLISSYIVIAPTIVYLFIKLDIYKKDTPKKTTKIIIICSIAFMALGVLSLLLSGIVLPRVAYLIGWIFVTLNLVLARIWFNYLRNLDATNTAHDSNSKTVLIIGGAGYIGSSLVERLLSAGYKIKVLDILMFGDNAIKRFVKNPNLELIKGDLRSVKDIVNAIKGVKSVVHLGGLVGDPACAIDHKLTIEINLISTRMIVEIAKSNNIKKFIFASTCSVYGESNEYLNENSKLNPISLYAKSKIASEKILLSLAADSFAPTILRFGTIYGMSGRTRFDLVVNLLTAKAYYDKKITLYGGDQWRPFVHVQDAAEAVFLTLESDLKHVGNQTFNVGSNEQNNTLLEVGKLIQEQVSNAKIIDSGAGDDRRNYIVKFDKIAKVLNFSPNWTLQKGIKQIIHQLTADKVTDYNDIYYSNYKMLNENKNEIFDYFADEEIKELNLLE
jgi:nucleoside-diphosphate-sugar epimerase